MARIQTLAYRLMNPSILNPTTVRLLRIGVFATIAAVAAHHGTHVPQVFADGDDSGG